MIAYLIPHLPARALFGLGLCGLVLVLATGDTDAADVPQRSIPVTTVNLDEVVFYPARTAPATVVSLNDARVSAEISGVLRKVAVKVGQQVEEGMVVARIDCRDATEDLSQAQAIHEARRATNVYEQSQHAKAKKLSENKSISSEEIDKRRASASVSSAEMQKSAAEVSKARLAVERCDVKAPFNAVVVERLASVGDFVSRGTPVVRLLDTDSTEVRARVQEKDLESVRIAEGAYFESQDQRFAVSLRTVVPMMESRLRSYETRFVFDNETASPGSAGRLTWSTAVPHLPAELVVHRDVLGVFLDDDGHARFVAIPNAQQGKPAPWPGGLGGSIVVDGRFGIRAGDRLQAGEP